MYSETILSIISKKINQVSNKNNLIPLGNNKEFTIYCTDCVINILSFDEKKILYNIIVNPKNISDFAIANNTDVDSVLDMYKSAVYRVLNYLNNELINMIDDFFGEEKYSNTYYNMV